MTSVDVFEENLVLQGKMLTTCIYLLNSFLMFLFLPPFAYNLWMSICLCKSEKSKNKDYII